MRDTRGFDWLAVQQAPPLAAQGQQTVPVMITEHFMIYVESEAWNNII